MPVAAALGVVARFAVKRYLESRLYHDGTPILSPDATVAAVPVANPVPPAISKP